MDIRRSPFRYCPKNTHPGKNIKEHASKEAEKYYESISQNLHIFH